MHYPRPVTTIKQIEFTSRCNLACVYCPQSGAMTRAKLDMTTEIFEKAMWLVKYYCVQGTQGELALTGLGESLLHPLFADWVRFARTVIGWQRPLTIATNGILLTDELCEQIKTAKPLMFVSLHRPEVAGPAIERCRRHGLWVSSNNSFVDAAVNWAGQVEWFNSAPVEPCEFLRSGWGVVLADGSITTCCFDADGSGVVGTVNDAPQALHLAPYKLCETCSYLK